jgi:hypothetical protein
MKVLVDSLSGKLMGAAILGAEGGDGPVATRHGGQSAVS